MSSLQRITRRTGASRREIGDHIRVDTILIALLLAGAAGAADSEAGEYRRRVEEVRRTPGFVALWDFVKRETGGAGRFAAHQRKGDRHDFHLDAVNYVRDYWGEGREAAYRDFPLLGRGPFGQAVRIRREEDPAFRPCLLVPRERLHGSGLDAKGPRRSVSMVVWLIRESGNHALAGIWHEGTDLRDVARPAARMERGKRQYALFAGLGANNGASAVHVSENGARSFGDKYARNLAVTPEVIPAVPADSPAELLDRSWSVAAFSFDNRRNTVTAYLDGKATDYWVDDPAKHPFFQWPAKGWAEGLYRPPEGKPLSRTVVSESGGERVELHQFPFTRVRVTLRGGKPVNRELAALRVNPFWFGHDLYSPAAAEDGGPFTIGRVIHSSRSVGATGYIGGVAVFDRPLSAKEMERLAAIARQGPLSSPGQSW
jgi:hypothetical protein